MTAVYADRTIDDSANDFVEPLTLDAELKADATFAAFGLAFRGVQLLGKKFDPAAGIAFHFDDADESITQPVKDSIDAVLAAHAGATNTHPGTVGDSLNDSVDLASLRAEVLADATVQASGLTFAGPEVRGALDDAASALSFVFVPGEVVSAAVKTALDAVLAAHAGAPTINPQHLAGRLLIRKKTVGDDVWTKYGTPVVTRPGFWSSDLTKLVGQVAGIATVVAGAGGEKPMIRLCEKLSDGSDAVEIRAVELEPGTTTTFEFKSTTVFARPGLNQYYIEARLNGAVSCELEGVSLDLFRLP